MVDGLLSKELAMVKAVLSPSILRVAWRSLNRNWLGKWKAVIPLCGHVIICDGHVSGAENPE
jgi:hypothetical protein